MTDNEKELASKVAVKVPQPDSVIEVKVSPPGGDIEVQVAPSGDSIEVRVSPGGRLVEVRIGPPLSVDSGAIKPVLPVETNTSEIFSSPVPKAVDEALELEPDVTGDCKNVVEIQDEEEVLELEPEDSLSAEEADDEDEGADGAADLTVEAAPFPSQTDTLWIDKASDSVEDELDRELINEALNAEPVLEDDLDLAELHVGAVLAEIAEDTTVVEDEELVASAPADLEGLCDDVLELETQESAALQATEVCEQPAESLAEIEEPLPVEEDALVIDGMACQDVVEEDAEPDCEATEVSPVDASDDLNDLWAEVLEADAAETEPDKNIEESEADCEAQPEPSAKEEITTEAIAEIVADEDLAVVSAEDESTESFSVDDALPSVEPLADDLDNLWNEVLETEAAEIGQDKTMEESADDSEITSELLAQKEMTAEKINAVDDSAVMSDVAEEEEALDSAAAEEVLTVPEPEITEAEVVEAAVVEPVPVLDDLENLWSEVLEADAAEIGQGQNGGETIDACEADFELAVQEEIAALAINSVDDSAVAPVAAAEGETTLDSAAAEEIVEPVLPAEEALSASVPEMTGAEVVEAAVAEPAPVLDDLENLWPEVLEADAVETEAPEKTALQVPEEGAPLSVEASKAPRTLKARALHASLRRIKKH